MGQFDLTFARSRRCEKQMGPQPNCCDPELDQNINQTPHLYRFRLELLTIKHLQLHPFILGLDGLSTHPISTIPPKAKPQEMCFSDLPYVSPDQQVDCSARPVYVEPYRRRRSSNPQLAFVRYRRGSRRSPVPWERGDLRYQWDGQAWILHRWSVRHFLSSSNPNP